MSEPQAIMSLVTLGIGDLTRSIRFYEALCFSHKAKGAEGVGFFQAGACAFAVWPLDELAKDSNAKDPSAKVDEPPQFRGVALAWNCRSESEVDTAIEKARGAGGSVPKPRHKTSWGGYAGYFADPDGHLWEVAHNPGFPLTPDGRLTLPD